MVLVVRVYIAWTRFFLALGVRILFLFELYIICLIVIYLFSIDQVYQSAYYDVFGIELLI